MQIGVHPSSVRPLLPHDDFVRLVPVALAGPPQRLERRREAGGGGRRRGGGLQGGRGHCCELTNTPMSSRTASIASRSATHVSPRAVIRDRWVPALAALGRDDSGAWVGSASPPPLRRKVSGRIFDSLPEREQRLLVERLADQLQPERQTLPVHSRRHRG